MPEIDPDIDMPAEALRRVAEQYAIPDDEVTLCRDCGIDAWGFEEDGRLVHEDFHVLDDLWDATCPDDAVIRWVGQDGQAWAVGTFVVCIGCFERRLGRRLTLRDFMGEERYASMSVAEREAFATGGPSDHYVGPVGPDLRGIPPSTRYVDRWGTAP